MNETLFAGLIRWVAFLGAGLSLFLTLRTKPWREATVWRAWLVNTALLFFILAVVVHLVPKRTILRRSLIDAFRNAPPSARPLNADGTRRTSGIFDDLIDRPDAPATP